MVDVRQAAEIGLAGELIVEMLTFHQAHEQLTGGRTAALRPRSWSMMYGPPTHRRYAAHRREDDVAGRDEDRRDGVELPHGSGILAAVIPDEPGNGPVPGLEEKSDEGEGAAPERHAPRWLRALRPRLSRKRQREGDQRRENVVAWSSTFRLGIVCTPKGESS